jgi:hypothetical protein
VSGIDLDDAQCMADRHEPLEARREYGSPTAAIQIDKQIQ